MHVDHGIGLFVGLKQIGVGDALQEFMELRYGGEDKFCPAGVGPWLEGHLPEATLHFRPGDGHLGVMDHTREVLETLALD